MQDCNLIFCEERKLCPSIVRYIKLGNGGRLEKTCIEHNSCYIGFGTDRPEIFEAALRARSSNTEEAWDEVGQLLYDRALENGAEARRSSATRAKNQIRSFYTAGSETLWVTFYAGKLHYAFLDASSAPEISTEARGSIRRVQGQWKHVDASGGDLSIDRLSGQITKTQIFRGTSCEIRGDSKSYLLRRLNAEPHSYITQIEQARKALEDAVADAIRALSPDDFETLVELIFSNTLRRISKVGKVQKYVDIVFEDPLSPGGDEQCVQVKSQTSVKQLREYLDDPQRQSYSRFFYVFHKSDDLTEDYEIPPQYTGDIRIMGVETLSGLVVENGLVSWLVNKSG